MAYNHQEIEKKWRKQWEKDERYTTPDKKRGAENEYVLVEFPYPSGDLHVGHWYAFAVPDIYARFRRLHGKNVLFPIGFDAFGLPAENAALKHGVNPRTWTYDNMNYMRGQLKSMGTSFDWSREVITCDPTYYRWTQWLFLQLFKKGLAYRAEGEVNWCPSCKTVLANEQVIAGLCERCDTQVEKRVMQEWRLRITDYAERLLDDLGPLDWPEEIKTSQRNWIGKSEGAAVEFVIATPLFAKGGGSNPSGEIASSSPSAPPRNDGRIEIFTTRLDTIFGATFLVISPELAKKWLEVGWQASKEVRAYVAEALKGKALERLERGGEKTGVDAGIRAVNPATGKEIPVWVADYVLGAYGTGAIMAVPAHDERDFEFAKKFKLQIVEVVAPTPSNSPSGRGSDAFVEDGVLIHSGEFNGLSSAEAREKIARKIGAQKKTHYHLRDWGISRQRYWGVPIPIVHCRTCGIVPVPEKALPVELPEVDDYLPREDGKSPLAKAREWVKVSCPKCGGKAERETDTFDTFIDSSWYYLRYTDPKNKKEFAAAKKQKEWMPIDLYSGGAEHTTMHLLYSRFFHKALFDLGLVADREPYARRMNRGLILGPDGNKMSKSSGNVINPDEVVAEYGADTVRIYLAFIGPYSEVGAYPWNPKGVVGVRRFLEKVCDVAGSLQRASPPFQGGVRGGYKRGRNLDVLLHKTIKRVSEDLAAMKFNTAISQLMIMANAMLEGGVSKDTFKTYLTLLAPFAPHLSEELWRGLGHKKSIFEESWPTYDPTLVKDETIELAVQVNGKLRGTVSLAPDAKESEAKAAALGHENVKKHLDGKSPKKVIYVAGRLINFVL